MEEPEGELLYGGRIWTGRGFAEAMLVDAGRVVALGGRRELLRQRPTGTPARDLRGHLLLPGLIDSHLHVGDCLLREVGVDLRGATGPKAVRRRLERAARGVGPGGYLLGGGWDQERFPGRRWPSREWLDRLSEDRPILLDRVCSHVSWLNSAALAALGIDRDTAEPPDGRIGRDARGEPDGLLFEGAIRLTRPIRDRALADRSREMRDMLSRWAERGLTRVGAMSVGGRELAQLSDLDRRAPLPLRVHAYLRFSEWAKGGRKPPGERSPSVHLTGVKLHLDGALGARTAWLSEPYADSRTERGRALAESRELPPLLAEARAAGFALALHAIGDRALQRALELLEEAAPHGGGRVEHASVSPPPLVRELARRQIPVVVQPGFRHSDWWLRERLGPVRASYTHAFGTLARAGVALAGSSDAPVESVDPWEGLWAATHRPRRGSARESVSPWEALALYTTGGSRALGVPEAGRLSEGGPADYLEIAAPSLARALGERRRVRPVRVVVGGRPPPREAG